MFRNLRQRFGLGPGGTCKCITCGYSTPHVRGSPCFMKSCPKCNFPLIRI